MTEPIERELTLPAEPEQVWEAVTDPAWLSLWLAESVELEPRPGGEARFVVDGEPRTGWVEEASPPRRDGRRAASARLAFWWSTGDDPASRVELELTACPDGTRLRVCESRPLEVLDLVGIPLPGQGGGRRLGPALVAA